MQLSACRIVGIVGLLGLAALRPAGAVQLEEASVLQESFDAGWQERWREQRLAWRKTLYRTVERDGEAVLRAESWRSASGLWRPLRVDAPVSGTISWRWKIEHPIPRNRREREKRGDDYAARVFVVFGGEFAERDARAVCYVWAADLPVGSVFASPYTENVAMIVVASGVAGAGEWAEVERDFVSDYRAFFGEPPRTVSAVAVMVDTDNTSTLARTFFDDILVAASAGVASPR